MPSDNVMGDHLLSAVPEPRGVAGRLASIPQLSQQLKYTMTNTMTAVTLPNIATHTVISKATCGTGTLGEPLRLGLSQNGSVRGVDDDDVE